MTFLNLLVLRCAEVNATRLFYECLNLKFTDHLHGSGPVHAGADDAGGVLLELYPATEKNPVDQCGLGFGVPTLESVREAFLTAGFAPGAVQIQPWGTTFVVRDPDGRRVEVKLASHKRP